VLESLKSNAFLFKITLLLKKVSYVKSNNLKKLYLIIANGLFVLGGGNGTCWFSGTCDKALTKWHRSNFEHNVPHHNGINWLFKGGIFGEHWQLGFAVNQPSSGFQTLDMFECFLTTLALIVFKNNVRPV